MKLKNIFLVYSVSNSNSWSALERMREMVVHHTKLRHKTPVVVAGNMMEMNESRWKSLHLLWTLPYISYQFFREVTRVEVEAKAMFEWNFGYKECSSKLGIGINQVLIKIFKLEERNLLHAIWAVCKYVKCDVRFVYIQVSSLLQPDILFHSQSSQEHHPSNCQEY